MSLNSSSFNPAFLRDGSNQLDAISFWNTALPMAILAVLAVAIPWLLVRKSTRSQMEVLVTIWASAGFLLLAGAAIFAILYQSRGVDAWDAFTQAPLATSWFFLKLSGYTALLWVPILGLVWLGLAQGVNKRRGEDLAKERK